MKKITRLVISSFIGPFVMTFFIALFILLMQFLWKYIDDLVGKGLDWMIVFKLMVYVSVTLVPLALPLAMLLSSIMTFGNLAEHSELVACKSAGMSVQRIMRPLALLTIGISIGAFYFSNNVLPVANLKMNALLYDVRNQKPALMIQEGIFYNGIEGYVIRVGKKDNDNRTIHDVMIYDHTQNRGNNKVILAQGGTMAMSEDERFLILTLFNGKSFEERIKSKGADTHPLMRTEFAKEVIRFDLSEFKMTRTNEKLFKDNYQMLNLHQLSVAADSLMRELEKSKSNYSLTSMPKFFVHGNKQVSDSAVKTGDFIERFESRTRSNILASALSSARNAKSLATDAANDITNKGKTIAKHLIEWHRKFTLSIACLILFFIGAPLGAIIRKGGLGMPVVVSVVFFLTYHVISISAEKFAREGVLAPYKAMWISSIVLLPVGIFLTYKATTDSALFDASIYVRYAEKVFGKRKSK